MAKTNELLNLYEEVVLKSIQSINSITLRVEKLAEAQNVLHQCFSRIDRKINLIDIQNGHSNLEVRNICAKVEKRFDSLQKEFLNLRTDLSKIDKQYNSDDCFTEPRDNEHTIQDPAQQRKQNKRRTRPQYEAEKKDSVNKIEAFSADMPQLYKVEDLLNENQRIGRKYEEIISQMTAANEKKFKQFTLKIDNIKQELAAFIKKQAQLCQVDEEAKEMEKQKEYEQIKNREDDRMEDIRNELGRKIQMETVTLLADRITSLERQMPSKANKDETKRALVFLERKLNNLIADLPKQPQIANKEPEKSKKMSPPHFKGQLQIDQVSLLNRKANSATKCKNLSTVTTERQFQRIRKQATTYRSQVANFKEMSESLHYPFVS